MISVQKKFFELLEQAAEKEDMQVVVHQEWSNTGRIHLQEKDSFETWLSIPFQFNQKISFGWHGGSEALSVFPKRSNPRFALFNPGDLGDAISALIEYAVTQRNQFDASSIESDPMAAQRRGL